MTGVPDDHPPFSSQQADITAAHTEESVKGAQAPSGHSPSLSSRIKHDAENVFETFQELSDEVQKSIEQIAHPTSNFAVEGSGIAIYVLWNRRPLFAQPLVSLPSEIVLRQRTLSSWYAIHLVWRPASTTAHEKWLTEAETEQAFDALQACLTTLMEAQASGNADQGVAHPIYQIWHVQKLRTQIPRFYRLRGRKRQEEQQQSESGARRRFVLDLQKHTDLHKEHEPSGWFPTTYTHYDREERTRGWIIVSPAKALVAGVDDSQARTLAGLIQHRDTDPTGQQAGIKSERYEDVLGRIGLWNSTQDIGETVSQLEDLVASGQKSTDGQVLLNLAISAIGILLTVASALQLANWQIVTALVLLALSSVLFWIYARSGKDLWLRIGLLVIVAMLGIDTAHLWYPFLAHTLAPVQP